MKQDTANKMQVKVLIPQTDNGRSKVTVYEVDGKVVEQKYNYGRGYGFKFLTLYPSIGHYENRLSQFGSEQIYSTTDSRNNTEWGIDAEMAIMKSGL